MRPLLRVLSPLLGLAVGVLGALVASEVSWAWARPDRGPLVLHWAAWQTALQGWTWAYTPVRLLAAGLALLVLGLLWVGRALKPVQRPSLVLDPSPDHYLEVSASAIADALRADAETIDGVSRARVRMVGTTAAPVVRLTLWLGAGAGIREVHRDINTRVLNLARESLGVESLPIAIRVKTDSAPRSRVR